MNIYLNELMQLFQIIYQLGLYCREFSKENHELDNHVKKFRNKLTTKRVQLFTLLVYIDKFEINKLYTPIELNMKISNILRTIVTNQLPQFGYPIENIPVLQIENQKKITCFERNNRNSKNHGR